VVRASWGRAGAAVRGARERERRVRAGERVRCEVGARGQVRVGRVASGCCEEGGPGARGRGGHDCDGARCAQQEGLGVRAVLRARQAGLGMERGRKGVYFSRERGHHAAGRVSCEGLGRHEPHDGEHGPGKGEWVGAWVGEWESCNPGDGRAGAGTGTAGNAGVGRGESSWDLGTGVWRGAWS
jgi:hypothetical protein